MLWLRQDVPSELLPEVTTRKRRTFRPRQAASDQFPRGDRLPPKRARRGGMACMGSQGSEGACAAQQEEDSGEAFPDPVELD